MVKIGVRSFSRFVVLSLACDLRYCARQSPKGHRQTPVNISALRSNKCAPGPGVGGITLKGAPAGRSLDHGYMSRSTREARVNRKVDLCVLLSDLSRRGLSRVEAEAYNGVSPSKPDELRKANHIAPVRLTYGARIHGDAQVCLDISIYHTIGYSWQDAERAESNFDNGIRSPQRLSSRRPKD